jgi:hypothetical protein
MTQQNTGAPPPPPQQQHVNASPNPTVDDGKTSTEAGRGKVEAQKVQPANGATAAPMKTDKPTKRRRARPRRP